MTSRIPHLILALIAFSFSGCGDSESDTTGATRPTVQVTAEPWFKDVAKQSGLEFTWQSGADGDFNLPEIIGGGAAMIDYDRDGDLDLYFLQGGQILRQGQQDNLPNQLFRNDGNWNFVEVPGAAGADDRGYGMSVTTGDYDNDGDTDLYITNVGRDTLLRNDGGRFVDATEAAGLGDTGWGSATAFVDYDADGHLDLYVGKYLEWSPETEITCYSSLGKEDYCAPGNYPVAASDLLYRNRGDGTFEDVSKAAGIKTQNRTALGITTGDYDGDGHMDIFIANDGKPDTMWRNQGDGTFLDVGMRAGCAMDEDGKEKAGMGVGSTDLDDDGDLDLVVCNLVNESDSMFLNQGDYFIDATARKGVKRATSSYTRFGLGWIDLDNDGHLDLYEATGHVQRRADSKSDDPYAQEDLLLRGTPGGRFEMVKPSGGTSAKLHRTSRAAVFGDLDDDGLVDVLVVNRDAPANLYRNVVASPGNWCVIRVLNEHGQDAIGAVLTGQLGERTITRPVQTAHSYFAANDPRIHIGLGPADRLEAVEILWPDGTRGSFGDLTANQVHEVRRMNGSDPEGPASADQ